MFDWPSEMVGNQPQQVNCSDLLISAVKHPETLNNDLEMKPPEQGAVQSQSPLDCDEEAKCASNVTKSTDDSFDMSTSTGKFNATMDSSVHSMMAICSLEKDDFVSVKAGVSSRQVSIMDAQSRLTAQFDEESQQYGGIFSADSPQSPQSSPNNIPNLESGSVLQKVQLFENFGKSVEVKEEPSSRVASPTPSISTPDPRVKIEEYDGVSLIPYPTPEDLIRAGIPAVKDYYNSDRNPFLDGNNSDDEDYNDAADLGTPSCYELFLNGMQGDYAGTPQSSPQKVSQHLFVDCDSFKARKTPGKLAEVFADSSEEFRWDEPQKAPDGAESDNAMDCDDASFRASHLHPNILQHCETRDSSVIRHIGLERSNLSATSSSEAPLPSCTTAQIDSNPTFTVSSNECWNPQAQKVVSPLPVPSGMDGCSLPTNTSASEKPHVPQRSKFSSAFTKMAFDEELGELSRELSEISSQLAKQNNASQPLEQPALRDFSGQQALYYPRVEGTQNSPNTIWNEQDTSLPPPVPDFLASYENMVYSDAWGQYEAVDPATKWHQPNDETVFKIPRLPLNRLKNSSVQNPAAISEILQQTNCNANCGDMSSLHNHNTQPDPLSFRSNLGTGYQIQGHQRAPSLFLSSQAATSFESVFETTSHPHQLFSDIPEAAFQSIPVQTSMAIPVELNGSFQSYPSNFVPQDNWDMCFSMDPNYHFDGVPRTLPGSDPEMDILGFEFSEPIAEDSCELVHFPETAGPAAPAFTQGPVPRLRQLTGTLVPSNTLHKQSQSSRVKKPKPRKRSIVPEELIMNQLTQTINDQSSSEPQNTPTIMVVSSKGKRERRGKAMFNYENIKVAQRKVQVPNLQNYAVGVCVDKQSYLSQLVSLHGSGECNILRPRYYRDSLDNLSGLHPNVYYEKNTGFGPEHPYQQEFTRVELDATTGQPKMETRSALCAYCEEINFYELKNSCYSQHMSHSHGIYTDNFLAPNPLFSGKYQVSKKASPNRKTQPRVRYHEGVVCPACFEVVEIRCWSSTSEKKPLSNYLRHFKERHRVDKRKETFFNLIS